MELVQLIVLMTLSQNPTKTRPKHKQSQPRTLYSDQLVYRVEFHRTSFKFVATLCPPVSVTFAFIIYFLFSFQPIMVLGLISDYEGGG